MFENIHDYVNYIRVFDNVRNINIGGFNIGFLFVNKELAVALVAVGMVFFLILKAWMETPWRREGGI